MSTLAYAALTNRREKAPPPPNQNGLPGPNRVEQPGPNRAEQPGPTGLKTYVDAFAALVPAEVLTMHAVIISVTTKTIGTPPVTTIVAAPTLVGAFYGLIVLSMVLYIVPRLSKGSWDKLDYIRMLIPPLAFTGWTMLQRTTAFDAVYPGLGEAPRTVIALFLGVILGLAASALATKAEEKPA
jgi:hypothetical protein